MKKTKVTDSMINEIVDDGYDYPITMDRDAVVSMMNDLVHQIKMYINDNVTAPYCRAVALMILEREQK